MTFQNPAHRISRSPVHGVGHYSVFLSPAVATPPLPEKLAPTNPVPEFMQSLGLYELAEPHTLHFDLMNRTKLEMWDGRDFDFFLCRWPRLRSPFNSAVFPAPTLRIPRGVIFHGATHAHGPPPHTIHWHGIEPTPMNDGVGHCSTEIGTYTYQFQPNFTGLFFYHCHRNTPQHFDFGLYGALFVEPPDAFETGSDKNPGGYPRRTGANTSAFPQFPGYIDGPLSGGDPRAMTIPYDVEALWVCDDMDSRWRNFMKDPRAGIARVGDRPGVNDRFERGDFHDFNSDYWFVTGVSVPGRLGGTGAIPPLLSIPRALNCGVDGMQISVNARVGQTVLIRLICASYDMIEVRLPVDAVVIGRDGRALGVFPRGQYSRPFPVPVGTPLPLTTAQRLELLIRTETPLNSFAEVRFKDARDKSLRFTAQVPFRVRA